MLGIHNPSSEIVRAVPLLRRGIAIGSEELDRGTPSLILAVIGNRLATPCPRDRTVLMVARQQIQMTP
jgi:hypothetical protein